MRWEMLFADLESRLEAESRAERDGVVADLTRAEAATITVADRLRSVRGAEVHVSLAGDRALQGTVREVHEEWVLLNVAGREVIVLTAAVESWSGIGVGAAPGAGPARRQGASGVLFGLAHALRGVARDRRVVVVATTSREQVGRINRVGRDHLDLVPEPVRSWGTPGFLGERGRVGAQVQTVPFGSMVSVAEVVGG